MIFYPGEGRSLSPDADLPEDRRPPFTGAEPATAFGDVIRAATAAGAAVDLIPLLADTQGMVFWVPTDVAQAVTAILGAVGITRAVFEDGALTVLEGR